MRITLPNPKRFSTIFESLTGTPLNNLVTGISTDSRESLEGDLFIAIDGEKSSGHDYLNDVKNSGTVAALVNKPVEEQVNLQIIQVTDTILAIARIANTWRNQYKIPIIGITGSNGKTTTKDLLKHFLEAKFIVHSTKGNFNTSIGLPLTLLTLDDTHEISVVEMGANKQGDIKFLCDTALPTDGLITNIGPAHLEGFGSVANVAKEKLELFNSIETGNVFINMEDNYLKSAKVSCNRIRYGCKSECDYTADYCFDDNGNIILIVNSNDLKLNSQSMVFAKNVLAACSVANTYGINWETIQNKIMSFNPTYGRNVITQHDRITVIDDTYNANYNSTEAALDQLSRIMTKGRKIFVFGDMAELGEYSKEYHEKIGKRCDELGIDAVFTIGKETKIIDRILKNVAWHKHFEDRENLAKNLLKFIKKNDVILFKGSRSMEMEKIIQGVTNK